MKAILSTLILLSSSYVFSADSVECARTKRNMVVLCQAMERECNLIPDCLKRRDSCGAGIPESAGACEALHQCNQDLHQQYPSEFSEDAPCKYQWAEIEGRPEDSFCRVKSSWILTESACPGNRSLFNLLITSVDSSVDLEYNCAHLESRYQAKMKQCDQLRAEFKVKCAVEGSEEDEQALEDSKYGRCDYFTNFRNYFSNRSMILNVRRGNVHDGARESKPTNIEEGQGGGSNGSRPR